MISSYSTLIQKLNEFRRKYYLNRLLRGLIYFIGITLISFLLAVGLTYFFDLGITERTILFYGLITLVSTFFLIYLLWPLSKYLSIGKLLSNEDASLLIGKHFQEIDDKLYNVLQLKSLEQNADSDLIKASIDQKIKALTPIPFTIAVDFSDNRKYIKYALAPIIVLLLLGIFQPNVLKEGTNQLVAHTAEVTPLAPYSIIIENEKLEGIKSQSFTLKLKLDGEEIPNKLYLSIDDKQFLLNKNLNAYSYTLQNLQEELTFSLYDGEYRSKNYVLKVLPKPVLTSFEMLLSFPKYLNREAKKVINTGDVTVPEGTSIKWDFKTQETNKMLFIQKDTALLIERQEEELFNFQDVYYKSQLYGISSANDFIRYSDTVFYGINVVPDAYPSIELDVKQDSSNLKTYYFKGLIKDDYGLTALRFYAEVNSVDNKTVRKVASPVPFNSKLTQTDFYFLWSTDSLNLKAGESVRYYFEAWDNDGVNGRKSSKSTEMLLKVPTEEGLQQLKKVNDENIKEALSENIEEVKKIKEDLESLNKKLLTKKEVGYQEKQKIKDILERQQKVEQNIERLIEQNKQSNQLQEEFDQSSEELLEKQKQLEELFDKVMTDEMKEMMQKIEEMMDKLNKNELQKSIEKLELSNEDLENELDRNLELFKQLELEKNLMDAQEKLEKMIDDQEALTEKTKEKKENTENLREDQEKLLNEMDELRKDLDDIKEKNEELEEPNSFEETKSLEEDIKNNMQESADKLSKKQNKKASESQKDAKSKMDELSNQLSQMQMQMQSGANAENLEDLRNLLENLIQLSFDQEEVMETLKTTDRNDPKYVTLSQTQRKLKDDSQIIQDSLFALSKRVMQLESKINREIAAVNFNMEKALEELQERNTAQANSRQQFSMTSINNLALMLDEALQAMQNQMMMQQGGGKCSKPGGKGSNSSSANLKKLQQQLNKQMSDMKKAMEKGSQPGGKKGQQNGQGGANGQKGMSKSLAKMAAKQAAIREELRKMESELGKGGGGNKLKELQELMEKTETDLVNKQITRETIRRQEDILTRLLESEKAEREREKEKKRKSTESKNEIYRNPNEFFEYNSRKEKELELMKTMSPSFNSFYKNKVSEYFNQIEQ